MGIFLARGFFALAVALTLLQLWAMASAFRRDRDSHLELERLRKLASITIQQFADRKALTEKAFWTSIGRADPMVDAWGSPYRLEVRSSGERKEYFWRSTGPDRSDLTGDDIEVKVPYADGPAPDLGPPEGYTGFPALDAK